VFDTEYRVTDKTIGVERWIATRGQTHFDKGRPVLFYGIALDISGRKRIERAL
jgi:PAS domain-containing protein